MSRTKHRLSWPAIAVVVAAAPGMATAEGPSPAGATPAETTSSNAADSNPSSVTLEEVVVASDRYQATDLQLQSTNSVSVLSAKDLDNTAVHNVAEALSLMPGVNVMNTGQSFVGGVDGAARGEGMFVAVRGMNAEYNVNLIDGVEVAQGQPYSRGVQLSLLPPSVLKTIVLNKTSTADMDGDAIGGTIDFRTPTAFDYSGPEGNITVGTRFESRASDYHKDPLGYDVSGELARRFGANDEFGLYVEAYTDFRYFYNSELGGVMEALCCDNAWAFKVADANGNTPAGVDPAQNLELTGANVGVSYGFERRMGGDMSLDWRPDDTLAAYSRLTYSHQYTEQNSALTQIVGMGVLQGSASPYEIGTTGLYQPDIANVSIRYWFETNPEVAELGTYQLGFTKKIDGWTIAPNAFVSWGRDDRPDHIEIDARSNSLLGGDVTDNGFPYGGTSLFTYSNNFPYPTLTSQMTSQLNNILGLPAYDRGEVQEGRSHQTKGGARVDLQYDFGDGLLESVKFGTKYVDSSREVNFRDWTIPGYAGGDFGSEPIWTGSFSHVFPGKYGWADPYPSLPSLFSYFTQGNGSHYIDTCDGITVNNWNCDTLKGTEAVASGYAMLQMRAGDWEFIPGVRFEHTDIKDTFWVIPKDVNGDDLAGHFGNNYTHYNEALPSILVNYRPSATTVYRGAIWTSYERPPFVQLAGSASVSPSASGTTTITEGNPNLKAITATNYDLSGEWKTDSGGFLTAAAFFKQIQHYLFDNGSSAENTTSTGAATGTGILYIEPTNGGSAQVYGVELGGRQKFKWLPAPFDGLGIEASATGEHTGVHLDETGLKPVERMQNAPNWMGNVELFYEARGLELGVIYNYSGAFLVQYDYMDQHASWDDLWMRARQRVDLHAGYTFEQGVKLDLGIANLLRNYQYWTHIGEHTLQDSDIVDSGTTAFFNVSYKF